MYKEILSYEKACEVNKQDPNQKPIVDHLDKEEASDVINNFELKRIVRAVNKNDDGTDWKFNYRDGSDKFTMYFGVKTTEAKPSGVGFSYSYCDDWRSYTYCGSRLEFRDYDRMKHVQDNFQPLLEKVYLILD